MRRTYYAFSKIGGSGLFASRKIREGQIIFHIRGAEIIHHRYTPKFSPTGPNWVAMKNIDRGQEILIDYSITEEDPYWQMGSAIAVPSNVEKLLSAPPYNLNCC